MVLLVVGLGSCKTDSSKSDLAEANPEQVASYHIPVGENTWMDPGSDFRSRTITQEGIFNWTDTDQTLQSYFRLNKTGRVAISLRMRAASGRANLSIGFAGQTSEVTVENPEFEEIHIGSYDIEQAGYQLLEIAAVEKIGENIVDIEEIVVTGSATEDGVHFVEDNFHFGRRGPSVHLRYEFPQEKEVLYFYNEIEVPSGEDVVGSFFMANGFSHGYFGIQVNSENERRILFSVWSPYDTQDPKEIPEDYRITLLKKGEEVYSGEFGNEGSGGQSYKKYMWQPDTTYRFLLKGEPAGNNNTDYSAYFYAPELGSWELIASFRRPYTDNYLGNMYSFLENFVPATGDTPRKAFYKNQWIYNTDGEWTESTSARFTADATARAGHRMDFAGGVEGEAYFMKNCGFFDDYTPIDSQFERASVNTHPQIDFEALP